MTANDSNFDQGSLLEYNGEMYKYLGNGWRATGEGYGWRMSKDLYFRCAGCGYLMNGNPQENDNCPCNKLYKDSDWGRFGSTLGGDAIAVYEKCQPEGALSK
ncbi:MAG: hypothetical protein FWG66_16295 [Spirochaetes bacterium]|nr:hypothetical protein [Spirochaetota bacterium]